MAATKELGLGGGGVVFGLAAAISITLQPLQFRLVQLLEGYWSMRWLGWAFRLGVWRQQIRRARIMDRLTNRELSSTGTERLLALERMQAAETLLRDRFPAEERLLPTSLGNVLRSAEDRMGRRYGIDSVTIWPRLFPLLRAERAAAIEDEVTQLDVSVRLACTWAAGAFASALILVADWRATRLHLGWVLVPLALVVLARLSYRAAIESALAHAQDIEVALDLERGLVLEALRLPEPLRLSQERRMFLRVCRLLQTYSLDPSFDMQYRVHSPTTGS